MKWLLAVAVVALALSVSCIEIKSTPVVVTAEPMPEALDGSRWQDLPVRYCIVESADGFVAAEVFASTTARAFAAWGIEAVSTGACKTSIRQSDGINQIGWGVAAQEIQGGAEEAGFTRVLFQQCSRGCKNGAQNRIIEADITIVAEAPPRWRNERCLYSTLLHEIGHYMGLPHLDSPAIMAPASSTCDQRLTEADKAAFARLYSGG